MLKNNFNIRPETEQDYSAIRQLIVTAFENVPHSDGTEQDLVERLRQSESFVPELALVAENQGAIIGYILLTEIHIDEQVGLALAPLAVSPASQQQGVGRQLIETAHQVAERLGYRYSLVLGSNEYYPKFGYTQADSYGVKAPFDVPAHYFMLKIFGNKPQNLAGTAIYPKVFFE